MATDTNELAREQARKAIWSYLSSITPRELSGAEIDHLTSAAMQAVDSIGQKQPMSDPRHAPPAPNVCVNLP
jgi:hypothetical protein